MAINGYIQKKRKNYFSNNIERFGENFLEQFDAKKLRNDARRIFSDIAFGNIDYDQYWMYFTDSMLISALIDVASTKYIIHDTSYKALAVYINICGSSGETDTIATYHRRNAEAYKILSDFFMNIRSQSYSVESITQLKILSNRMKEYGQDLIDPVFGNMNSGSTVAVTNYSAPVYSQPSAVHYDAVSPIDPANNQLSEIVTPHFTIRQK